MVAEQGAGTERRGVTETEAAREIKKETTKFKRDANSNENKGKQGEDCQLGSIYANF